MYVYSKFFSYQFFQKRKQYSFILTTPPLHCTVFFKNCPVLHSSRFFPNSLLSHSSANHVFQFCLFCLWIHTECKIQKNRFIEILNNPRILFCSLFLFLPLLLLSGGSRSVRDLCAKMFLHRVCFYRQVRTVEPCTLEIVTPVKDIGVFFENCNFRNTACEKIAPSPTKKYLKCTFIQKRANLSTRKQHALLFIFTHIARTYGRFIVNDVNPFLRTVFFLFRKLF